MSTDHPDAYYEGHAVGYAAGEDDVISWASETFNEWRQLKIYTHEELWALHELIAELRIRQACRDD